MAKRCILQDWVLDLGLRHQGVLISAVRGCDSAPKDDASKLLARCLRAAILNAHCGDAAKAKSFIEVTSLTELVYRMKAFRKNLDHYPHHYVMHMIHAIGIIGHHGPRPSGVNWLVLYEDLCRGLHMNPETMEQLDARLNAGEAEFAAAQQ